MTDVPPSPAIGEPEQSPERRALARLVGRNRAKFMPIYDARMAGRRWLPFCWPGFLFPQAWFLYRKMYLWAGLTAAGPLLASQLLHSPLLVSLPASIIGLFGRALYVRDSLGVLARIRAIAADEAEADEMIDRAGGVSPLGAAIGSLFVLASIALGAKTGALIPPAMHS